MSIGWSAILSVIKKMNPVKNERVQIIGTGYVLIEGVNSFVSMKAESF